MDLRWSDKCPRWMRFGSSGLSPSRCPCRHLLAGQAAQRDDDDNNDDNNDDADDDEGPKCRQNKDPTARARREQESPQAGHRLAHPGLAVKITRVTITTSASMALVSPYPVSISIFPFGAPHTGQGGVTRPVIPLL
jgi:hypothetical protein